MYHVIYSPILPPFNGLCQGPVLRIFDLSFDLLYQFLASQGCQKCISSYSEIYQINLWLKFANFLYTY